MFNHLQTKNGLIKNVVLKGHELRKLANEKHRDPLNATHAVLKQNKTLLNNKRNEYYNNKISELEDTTLNSDKKHFWKRLKSMDESVKQKVTAEISEENWLRHFQSLHSNDLLNLDQQVMNSTDYYFNKQLVQYVTPCLEFIFESLILLFELLFVIVKMLLQCCKSLLWPCK